MKIIEINPKIKALVDANDGYCPCAAKQNKGTMCICQEFRDMVYAGRCRCGRSEKVLEDEDILGVLDQLDLKMDRCPYGPVSVGMGLVKQIAAVIRWQRENIEKLAKENAALQDGYDAMARDLEMRTRQVRELQEGQNGPRKESDRTP